jgi:hypothetical protein
VRAAKPECRGSQQSTSSREVKAKGRKRALDPYMCTTWKGRRKHIDRVVSEPVLLSTLQSDLT